MDKIYEAYTGAVNERSSKIEDELHNSIISYEITELSNAGTDIGSDIVNAVNRAFGVASKSNLDAFKKSLIKQIEKI